MKPVIVPDTMSADTANNLYGERYGVDWQYAPPSVKVPANTTGTDTIYFRENNQFDGLVFVQDKCEDGHEQKKSVLTDLEFVEVASDHVLTHKPVDLPPQSWIGGADDDSSARVLQSDSRAPSIIPAVALYLTILAMAIILVLIFAGGAHA